MKLNTAVEATAVRTHEGGQAGRQMPLMELERAVATCLLWENTFYEQGSAIADRIHSLCNEVPLEDIGALAVHTRNNL